MKLLVKRHEGHIKDYGFLSDLSGETLCCGLNPDFVALMFEQGHSFSYEFVENTTIPPHVFNGLVIPKGTLNVYVDLNSRYSA